jgi:integrase
LAIRKRGKGHYEVVVYAGLDPTGRQRQLSRTVRGEKAWERAKAKEHELAQLAQVETGDTDDAVFWVLVEKWLKHTQDRGQHERSTRYQTDYYLRKHILPRWRNVPVRKIHQSDLNSFYGDLVKTLAPTTVRRIHGIVSAALEYGVKQDWIDFNPARRAEPPEGGRAPLTVPSNVQVSAVLGKLRAVDADLWAFVRVSAATGMRRGEVCALRASDVLPGALRKARAIGEGKGGAYEKTTKTGVRHLVALDRRTEAVLRWQAWRMRARMRALSYTGHGDVCREMPDHFLFSAADDCSRPWNPNSVTKRFRRAVGPGIQLRTLRHFVASELIGSGADIRTVASRLGHARTSTTLDLYAGLLPASDRAAADAIGKKLGR